MRVRSFLDTSLKLDGILDILEAIEDKPNHYTGLLAKSKIKFKVAFRKYLNFCVSKKFVATYEVMEIHHSTGRFCETPSKIKRKYYIVTPLGQNWLKVTKHA